MKKSLVSLLVVGACALFTVHAYAKAPKIGFILSTMQEERYQKDKKAFEDAVKKLGGTVVFASCNNNEQTQAAEVDNLLSKNVDVLVIQSVNGETASAFVKQATKDNVPVVAYDRLIANAPIAAYVTEDSVHTGELQAEAAAKAIHGKGNVVILKGQAGHNCAEERTAGIIKTFKKYPDIKVVVNQYHAGWSPSLAMQTTENALTQYKNNIQAIIANNSGMAHGAVQALEEQKLTGKVFVAGADADLANIKDMLANKQQFEVRIPIEEMAQKAAEVAVALAQKKDFKADGMTTNGYKTADGKPYQVKTINAPVVGVDRSQIEERIVRSGFHPRESVYGKVATK